MICGLEDINMIKKMIMNNLLSIALVSIFALSAMACKASKPTANNTDYSLTPTSEINIMPTNNQIESNSISLPNTNTNATVVQSTLNTERDCPNKWGTDSILTIQNISLYREFFKQNNFQAARTGWSYVFINAPCARITTLYDGIDMYKAFIKEEKDAATKTKLLDTLVMIYETRAKYFGEEGVVYGRMAVDLLTHRGNDNAKVVNTFEKAIKMGGNEIEYFTPIYYFKTLIKEYSGGKANKDSVLAVYNRLSRIIDANIANNNNADKFKDAKQSIDADLATNIIKDCDEIIQLFEPKLKANPANKELRDLVYNLLVSKKCSDKELFLNIAADKFKENPTAAVAGLLGQRAYNAKNYSLAITYFTQAADLETNNKDKATFLVSLGYTLYATDQFSKARQVAQDAIKLNPNFGKAYILIGDLYAASSTICGGGFEGLTAMWAAYDKYNEAKNQDPSVATEANNKAARVAQSFPFKDDIFMQGGMDIGGSYTVKCWINEVTTIRANAKTK